MIIYKFIFLLRLNVSNDLARAMKALDGKKMAGGSASCLLVVVFCVLVFLISIRMRPPVSMLKFS